MDHPDRQRLCEEIPSNLHFADCTDSFFRPRYLLAAVEDRACRPRVRGILQIFSFHPLELPNQLPPETEEPPTTEEDAASKSEEKPKIQENVESP